MIYVIDKIWVYSVTVTYMRTLRSNSIHQSSASAQIPNVLSVHVTIFYEAPLNP